MTRTFYLGLRRINHGSQISENSAEFADNIYSLKELFQRYGASSILIHHTSKDPELMGVNKLRGSSAIAGAVWGALTIDHLTKPDPNNKKQRVIDPRNPQRMLNLHARDSEGQTLKIELEPENCSWSVIEEVGIDQNEQKDLSDRILEALKLNSPGLTGKAIIDFLQTKNPDVCSRSVYRRLERLAETKVIYKTTHHNDKRRKVYYLENTGELIDNEKKSKANLKEENKRTHSPSPPLYLSSATNFSKTLTMQDLEDSDNLVTGIDNLVTPNLRGVANFSETLA